MEELIPEGLKKVWPYPWDLGKHTHAVFRREGEVNLVVVPPVEEVLGFTPFDENLLQWDDHLSRVWSLRTFTLHLRKAYPPVLQQLWEAEAHYTVFSAYLQKHRDQLCTQPTVRRVVRAATALAVRDSDTELGYNPGNAAAGLEWVMFAGELCGLAVSEMPARAVINEIREGSYTLDSVRVIFDSHLRRVSQKIEELPPNSGTSRLEKDMIETMRALL